MKKFLWVVLALALVGGGYGYYLYNKPHAKLSGESPAFVLTAKELAKAFETNEMEANQQYVGKLVEVNGNIAEISRTEDGFVNVLLETDNPMSTVMCQLDKIEKQDASGLKTGQTVRLKGLCSGYTIDVIMDRCILLQ